MYCHFGDMNMGDRKFSELIMEEIAQFSEHITTIKYTFEMSELRGF